MYVPAGSRAANSTDSYVQARTAPRNRRQKPLNRRMHRRRKDGSRTTYPETSPTPGMLKHTTGLPHPIHPPSTPDGPSMHFSQTRAPRQGRNSRHLPSRTPTHGNRHQRQAARTRLNGDSWLPTVIAVCTDAGIRRAFRLVPVVLRVWAREAVLQGAWAYLKISRERLSSACPAGARPACVLYRQACEVNGRSACRRGAGQVNSCSRKARMSAVSSSCWVRVDPWP
jgi:hypothetical protein